MLSSDLKGMSELPFCKISSWAEMSKLLSRILLDLGCEEDISLAFTWFVGREVEGRHEELVGTGVDFGWDLGPTSKWDMSLGVFKDDTSSRLPDKVISDLLGAVMPLERWAGIERNRNKFLGWPDDLSFDTPWCCWWSRNTPETSSESGPLSAATESFVNVKLKSFLLKKALSARVSTSSILNDLGKSGIVKDRFFKVFRESSWTGFV